MNILISGCALTLEADLQISHGNTAAHAAEHGDKVLGPHLRGHRGR